MALFAQIQNYKVVAIVNLASEEEILALASHSQHVVEATASVQVGWIFNGAGVVPPPGYDPITNIESQILSPAVAFATKITSRFTAENIAMGVTQVGKTVVIGDALRALSFWLDNGSLYAAIGEIQNIRAGIQDAWAPFITLARMKDFENQIRVYLGIPTI